MCSKSAWVVAGGVWWVRANDARSHGWSRPQRRERRGGSTADHPAAPTDLDTLHLHLHLLATMHSLLLFILLLTCAVPPPPPL